MPDENSLEKPASEREDRPDELYGTREYPPGLQTPLRPSEGDLPARPRCGSCGGRAELVELPWGSPYWRHLDLVDLEFPHAAHVDQGREVTANPPAESLSVLPAPTHSEIQHVEDNATPDGAEEDSCAAQDHTDEGREEPNPLPTNGSGLSCYW